MLTYDRFIKAVRELVEERIAGAGQLRTEFDVKLALLMIDMLPPAEREVALTRFTTALNAAGHPGVGSC